MTITSIELYDALIVAGVEKKKAERAAKTILSREDMKDMATKSDIAVVIGKIDQSRAEMFKFMAVQTLAIVAGVVGLMQMLA